MDSDQIYFDEIKREVMPDGRIRYYAEKIVTEVEIEIPRTKTGYEELMARSARQFMGQIVENMSKNDPYLKLLEGSVMATNRS